nr:syntaxin-71-like isoform X2 [Coffea arabica]
MSVIDIVFRLDDICKKYEKYDVEKQRSLKTSSEDAFARLFASFESQIEAALQKSEMAAMETSRAKVVAMNAEVRRVKARLMEEVPKLQKLAQKKSHSNCPSQKEGLDTLKNLAQDMNEELDRQVPLIDEIDTKVDTATSELKNTNVELNHTCNYIRSGQNMRTDIILLCILLGIAANLCNILSSQNVLISLMIFQSGTCSRFAGFRPSLTHFSYQLQ